MANNRLYLVDTETGAAFCLLKAMGDGWYPCHSTSELDDWLNMKGEPDGVLRDFSSSIGDKPTQFIVVDENHWWGMRDPVWPKEKK